MYKLPESDHILAELIQTADETLGCLTRLYYFTYLQKEHAD
jgi:hypothetical protein